MKTIYRITYLILIMLVASCQQEDAFDIPNELGYEENLKLNALMNQLDNGQKTMVTIADIKALMVSGEATEITSDLIIKGYVVSSDATGNFYKELYIQNSSSDASSAIRLLIDISDSYNMYNFGREIYIDLKGLYVGEYRTGDGVISLGEYDSSENRISNIREAMLKEKLLRSTNLSDLTPISVKFSQISSNHIGVFVEVSDVNVIASDAGKPYVDPYDNYDTRRTLEACDGFSKTTFLLETSSFATFKQDILPEGSGTIKGIVTKTYDGANLVLMLNTTDDVNLAGESCTLLDIDDFEKVLEEPFDLVEDGSKFDYSGWLNYNEAGNQFWTEQFYGGNGYVEFSGYRTGDAVNIGWLITPAFELTSATSAFVSFKLAQHHLDDEENNTLEIFVSTNFDGSNVAAASWTKLNATIPGEDNSWYAFQDSGLLDVSNYSGTLHLAFKYTGSGTNSQLDGGYFVDDVLFLKR
jgi:hypothetical protein